MPKAKTAASMTPAWRSNWKPPKRERSRCGARTRAGHPCRRLPVEGKQRCRNHGGLSTGAKTAKGKERVTANLAKTRSWQKRKAKEGARL